MEGGGGGGKDLNQWQTNNFNLTHFVNLYLILQKYMLYPDDTFR